MPPEDILPQTRIPGGRDGGPSLDALEASELRYRRLFETAQDGILILDGDTGRIVDVNPFLLDLLDYPFESIIGLELWEIGLFADIAANQAAFEKLQKDEYIRYENHPLRTEVGQGSRGRIRQQRLLRRHAARHPMQHPRHQRALGNSNRRQ